MQKADVMKNQSTKKEEFMHVRVDPDLKKELKAEAGERSRSLSNYVLYLVDRARGKKK